MTDYVNIIEYPVTNIIDTDSECIYVCKCKFDNNKTVFFKGERNFYPVGYEQFKIKIHKKRKILKLFMFDYCYCGGKGYCNPLVWIAMADTGSITPIPPSKVFELLL